MARQNLSGLTPEEVKAHKNKQAKDRMAKMRKARKDERDMAKKNTLLIPTSPEVTEFLTLTEGFKIAALTEAVAAWEREYKQRLPLEPLADRKPDETTEAYWTRSNRQRDLSLAKMFASDFYARQKAAARKKEFDAKEAREAKRLGITVFKLQKRRKIAAAVEAKKAREVQRLAEKEAA